MKAKYLLILTPAFILSLSSCDDSAKSAEDIEQEYTGTTSDNHEDVSPDQTETVETEVENTNTVDVSSFEYLEDFGKLNTKTKLYEAFGPENLIDGSQWFAEGTVEFQTTTLTDPNTLNTYYFMWDQADNETLSFIEAPAFIWDENYETARRQVIQSNSGVFTGMSIKDLHAWNGEDFSFYGFGWDYEGGVFAEEGSNISNAGVLIKLALEDYSDQNYTHLLGDMELNTSEEGILDSPIVVDRLTLYVDNPEF